MSPGLQAAQACHAAFAFSCEHPDVTSCWHDRSNYLIVLAAADETELRELLLSLRESDVPHSSIHEPDLDDELTAVAIAPSEVIARRLSSLPLALREPSMA